jgi:hypothetical protein
MSIVDENLEILLKGGSLVKEIFPQRDGLRSWLEIVERFAFSEARAAILKGLIAYRKELTAAGLKNGFQWIDGSFVEDIEASQKRPPNDIDVITFAAPSVERAMVGKWFTDHYAIFDQERIKNDFKCDAYFVDTSKQSNLLINDTCYWFGLFGHQRKTALWKGMLQVQLICNDDAALDYMNRIDFNGEVEKC